MPPQQKALFVEIHCSLPFDNIPEKYQPCISGVEVIRKTFANTNAATYFFTHKTNKMELGSTNLGSVKKAYQSFIEGNIQEVIDGLHDDAVYQYNAPAVVPMAGNFEGKQGILRFFQMISETVDIFLFEPQEFIDGGDKVVVIGREGARSKKTGKSYEGNFVHVADVEDGKVKRLRLYPDTAGGVHIFSE